MSNCSGNREVERQAELREPTPEQEAELRALVATVGMAYAFTHEEQREALALALNDPGAALLSYRAMAAELDHDDRRRCDQCANLRRNVCTIAEPKVGALVVANRDYHPVRDIPRRCKGYAPSPNSGRVNFQKETLQ